MVTENNHNKNGRIPCRLSIYVDSQTPLTSEVIYILTPSHTQSNLSALLSQETIYFFPPPGLQTELRGRTEETDLLSNF